MNISINCETCEHGNVCKYTPDSRKQLADRIKNALRPVITDPFMLTISCPHYSSRYYSGSLTTHDKISREIDNNCVHTDITRVLEATSAPEAYPTATLQEVYHAQQ